MAYWGVVGSHVANVDCSQITEGFFEHSVDTYTYWACTMISQFVCVCVCVCVCVRARARPRRRARACVPTFLNVTERNQGMQVTNFISKYYVINKKYYVKNQIRWALSMPPH